MPPVCGSVVARSKSTTPSNTPPARMKLLSFLRFSSCRSKPCAALVLPSADVSVAPITWTPGIAARMRATPTRMPAITASASALPFLVKSLMPASQIPALTPESVSTSRSRRCRAAGPPGKGFCGEYSFGPTTWLPPMPAFTTAQRPFKRRASTSGQRSSPLMVEAVPSVIESPNATTAASPLGAAMSSASRKYQEAVANGNGASDRSSPLAPAQFVACVHERQRHGVAPRRFPGRDGYALLAAECDRAVGAGHHRRARPLHADECAVERDRLRAERIGKAHPRLGPPKLRLDDKAERLVARPRFGGRKREREIGLRRRIAHRIRPLHGSGPARHPMGRPCGCCRRRRSRDQQHTPASRNTQHDGLLVCWAVACRAHYRPVRVESGLPSPETGIVRYHTSAYRRGGSLMTFKELTAALLFAACSLPALAQETLVVYWTKGFYPQEDKALDDMIDKFQKKTGVKVELSRYAPQESVPKAVAALDSGTPPDVAYGDVFDFQVAGKWAAEGRLEDLSDILVPMKADFLPVTIETVYLLNEKTKKRAYYAFPMKRQTMHIQYWKDMLADAGYKEADIPTT